MQLVRIALLLKSGKMRLRPSIARKFWAAAETRGSRGSEAVRYKSVERTSRPLVEHLGFLVNRGVVSVDLTLKEREVSDRPATVNDVTVHGVMAG